MAAVGGGTAAGGGGGGTVAPRPRLIATSTSPALLNPRPSGPGVVLQPATVTGSALTLQWGAVGGLPILEYVIEAGSGPGLSNVYNGSVGMATGLNANIGAGAYYVRVRARTGATTSVTSNEVSFSANFEGVAGCTAPPPSPVGLNATVAGVTAERVVAAGRRRDVLPGGGRLVAGPFRHLLRKRRKFRRRLGGRLARLQGIRPGHGRELVRAKRSVG